MGRKGDFLIIAKNRILRRHGSTSDLTNHRYEATHFIPTEHRTSQHNADTENSPKPTFSVKKWKKVLYIIGLWLLLVLIALAMFIITRGWDF